MGNKRPKPEEIVSKLRQVEVLMGQGMARLDAIRQMGRLNEGNIIAFYAENEQIDNLVKSVS